MATDARRRLTQRERVAESTQRLRDAAIEVIAEQGFERTTASDIAERAGYSRTMFAARYGTKEDLLEHLMRTEYERRMLPALEKADGLDLVLGWIASVRAQVRDDPKIIRAFYMLIFESAGPIPQLRPWTEDWLRRCVDMTRDALRAEPALAEQVDVDAEAEQFVAAAVGLAFRYVISGDLEAWDLGLDRLRQRFETMRRR